MNAAEDAETLAEALRVLSGRWSIASTPAVVSALIPLALGSLATARLALAEGIPPTSFRAEMRLARAVVDESLAVEGPEGLQELRMLREPPGRSANGLSRAPQGLGSNEPGLSIPGSERSAAGLTGPGEGPNTPPGGSQRRSGLDSPERGAIVAGRVVAEDGGRP